MTFSGVAARILTAIALSAGTAAAESFDPHEVPTDFFRQRIHKIAIGPILLRPSPPNAADVRQRIEELVGSELRRKGYEVLPGEDFLEEWVRFSEKLGGIYDPVTGEADAESWETVYEYAGRTLSEESGIDAVLFAFTTVAPLDFYYKGNWSSGVFMSAGKPVLWGDAPLTSVDAQGRPQLILGTYLNVEIRDLSNECIYGIRYPLEVVEVFAQGRNQRTPAEALFLDDLRLVAVTKGLLEPLVERPDS